MFGAYVVAVLISIFGICGVVSRARPGEGRERDTIALLGNVLPHLKSRAPLGLTLISGTAVLCFIPASLSLVGEFGLEANCVSATSGLAPFIAMAGFSALLWLVSDSLAGKLAAAND